MLAILLRLKDLRQGLSRADPFHKTAVRPSTAIAQESIPAARFAHVPVVRRPLGELIESTLRCPLRSALRTVGKPEKADFG
jgi:hypothetical protein